jgi:hypothetical protein
MGKTKGSSWEVLRHHRKQAAQYPLDILIWGPGKSRTVEYQTRVVLRKVLLLAGHNAQFSEDLCSEPGALADPLKDERLQAEAAHVIIMLYGSRGTQTERDVILTERELACKSIILIDKAVYARVLPQTISGKSWEEMSHLAKVIPFKRTDLPRRVVKIVSELTDQIRCACYIQDLRRRNLDGN